MTEIKKSKISEIVDFVLLSKDVQDMYAICKSYECGPCELYESYIVHKSSICHEFKVICIGDFLETHHYPLKTHDVAGMVMFRCKRF